MENVQAFGVMRSSDGKIRNMDEVITELIGFWKHSPTARAIEITSVIFRLMTYDENSLLQAGALSKPS